jgi:hypothetical protein
MHKTNKTKTLRNINTTNTFPVYYVGFDTAERGTDYPDDTIYITILTDSSSSNVYGPRCSVTTNKREDWKQGTTTDEKPFHKKLFTSELYPYFSGVSAPEILQEGTTMASIYNDLLQDNNSILFDISWVQDDGDICKFPNQNQLKEKLKVSKKAFNDTWGMEDQDLYNKVWNPVVDSDDDSSDDGSDENSDENSDDDSDDDGSDSGDINTKNSGFIVFNMITKSCMLIILIIVLVVVSLILKRRA